MSGQDIPEHLSDAVRPHMAGLDLRTRECIYRAAAEAAAKAGRPTRALIEALRPLIEEPPEPVLPVVTSERGAA